MIEAQINGLFCKKCGTHTISIAPTRIAEFYDNISDRYIFVDVTECGACGNKLKVRRRMKLVEQEMLDMTEDFKEE